MFCGKCGTELAADNKFCSMCGSKMGETPPSPPQSSRRLVRRMGEKQIAGVCAGVAHYLGVDVTLVRLAWLCTVIFWGTGFLVYVVCWMVIPRDCDAPAGNVAV
jgi:phage shock protein C